MKSTYRSRNFDCFGIVIADHNVEIPSPAVGFKSLLADSTSVLISRCGRYLTLLQLGCEGCADCLF